MRPAGLIAAPVVLIAAVALLGAACGDGGDGDGGTTVGAGGPSRPTGPGDVVVQVLISGGFAPVETSLTSVPTVTVLGDGTLITTAPVPAIYPGPAVTPLQSVKVDAATVDGLVERAEELGLLKGALEFGRPSIADAPTTTVTVTAGGRTHRHEAYGLGLFDEAAPERGSGPPVETGITKEAAANRRALSTFVEATQGLPPGRDSWKPAVVAVYDLGRYQPEAQLPQRPVDWPLATPPAIGTTTFPCSQVEGDNVRVLLAALEKANSRTPWVVAGSQRSLAFRPVVPGQPGCP